MTRHDPRRTAREAFRAWRIVRRALILAGQTPPPPPAGFGRPTGDALTTIAAVRRAVLARKRIGGAA